MRATGYVRKLDELGRIVIPIDLRRMMDLGEKDALEVYVDGDCVILKKYVPACIFCGEAKNIKNFHGKNICVNCMRELSRR